MAKQEITGFYITTEDVGRRLEVRLNGSLLGYHSVPYKPWQATEEAVEALAGLLRERLGWPQTEEDDDL